MLCPAGENLLLSSSDEKKPNLNDIKIISSDLEKLLKESSSQVDYDFDEEISKVAKNLGRAINQKETSVFEYYAATRN